VKRATIALLELGALGAIALAVFIVVSRRLP